MTGCGVDPNGKTGLWHRSQWGMLSPPFGERGQTCCHLRSGNADRHVVTSCRGARTKIPAGEVPARIRTRPDQNPPRSEPARARIRPGENPPGRAPDVVTSGRGPRSGCC
eukprot:gene10896-biopygen6321